MRKFSLLLFITLICGQNIFAQIGFGTSTPDSSAMLDLSSANKGLLPPRVELTATNTAAPVNNPAKFLLVCNTATAGDAPYNVEPGYYYWDGSGWCKFLCNGHNPGDMLYWDGTRWVAIPGGKQNEVLTWCDGKPKWGGCEHTVSFQPGPEGYDAVLDYKPGCNGGNATGGDYQETLVSVWTYDGIGCGIGTLRYLIKFAGVDSIPANAIILSAKLSFYGVSSSTIAPQGNSIYPGSPYMAYGSNEVEVQRVTSTWEEATVTWNTQPSSTSAYEVVIPGSNSKWNYDAVDLDVTTMVQEMKTSGNYGFLMKMQTEQYYRNMNFVSGDGAEVSKRPKLVITYRLP